MSPHFGNVPSSQHAAASHPYSDSTDGLTPCRGARPQSSSAATPPSCAASKASIPWTSPRTSPTCWRWGTPPVAPPARGRRIPPLPFRRRRMRARGGTGRTPRHRKRRVGRNKRVPARYQARRRLANTAGSATEAARVFSRFLPTFPRSRRGARHVVTAGEPSARARPLPADFVAAAARAIAQRGLSSQVQQSRDVKRSCHSAKSCANRIDCGVEMSESYTR